MANVDCLRQSARTPRTDRQHEAGGAAREAEPPGRAAAGKAEERYRPVVEDTPVLLCSFLPDGVITFVNRVYCEYFAKRAEELVGATFLTLIPETDRDSVMSHLSTLTLDSPTRSHEHRVIAPDGAVRWQRWTNRALFDRHGQVVSYQSIGEDVTERKLAELRLLALYDFTLKLGAANGLEQTLELCVRTALDHTAMDAGGVYLVEQQTGAMRLAYSEGLPPEFVAATSYYSVDSPSARFVHEGQPVFVDYSKLPVPKDEARHREGLRSIAVVPVQHRGQTVACLNVASHSLDGISTADRAMLTTLATHVGAFVVRAGEEGRRRQAEDALRESEAKYRLLAENATDVIWTMGLDLRVVYVSPSIRQQRGHSVEEVRAQSLSGLVVPESLPKIQALVGRQLALAQSGDPAAWDPGRVRGGAALQGRHHHLHAQQREDAERARRQAEPHRRGEPRHHRAPTNRGGASVANRPERSHPGLGARHHHGS